MLFLLLLVAAFWGPGGAQEKHNHREYEEGHQFPEGAEHMLFSKTVTYSAYMGQIKYPHLPLLFESMKWNAPNVDFVIINIIAGVLLFSTLHFTSLHFIVLSY